MADVHAIVARLNGHKNGSGWKARCPAHEDNKASLKIDAGEGGRVLLKCFAGCTYDSILSACGLTAKDCAPDQPGPGRGRRHPTGNPWLDSRIAKTYDYVDEAGKLLFQTVRFDPKDFRQRRPDGKNGWIRNLEDTRLVPYRLPEVLKAARAGGGVLIVEGEKDADAAAALGLVATCNPMGAGKWHDTFSELLRGAHVAIIADKDKPGRAHAQQVASSVHGKAASVRVLEMPGDGIKDLTDWIAGGGTALELRRLVRAALPWVPGQQPAAAAVAAQDWPPIVQLGAGKLPTFPVAALPTALGWFTAEEARAIQVPQDAIAMIVLAAVAAAVARKIRVEIAAGWQEPLNLYTAVVLPPGERKSQAMRDAAAPLEEWERQALRDAQRGIAEAKTRKAILEKRATMLQHKASRAKEGESLAELAQRAIEAARDAAEYKVPEEPKLLVDDITPEKLASALVQYGGRIGLFSPEGGIFDIMAGHYSKGSPKFEVFLKAHSGDTLRVDRVGRPSEHIADPALTMALAIQPDVVQSLSAKPGFRGRGLLGRFLYALPESLLGAREIEPPPVSEEARESYHRVVRQLLDLPAGDQSHVLKMQDVARMRFRSFQAELEPKLAPLAELGGQTDWAGKLAGAVARIAALFHLVEVADKPEPWRVPVTLDAVDRAIEVSGFLVAHAKAAYYGMRASAGSAEADYILKWIRKMRRESFSQRELQQAAKGRFHRVSELEEPISMLLEAGYIRKRSGDIGERGPGRPSLSFDVNPATYDFGDLGKGL